MRLVSVYDEPDADQVLYALLSERPKENWISHERLPTFREHQAFVASHPFRFWFLIETEDIMDPQLRPCYVGAIEVTDRNEIGIAIFKKHQRRGYGAKALWQFIQSYPPLPAIPAIRNGRWLANVAVGNETSKEFFRKMGFSAIQETMVLRDG